jgi:hypothetical protein
MAISNLENDAVNAGLAGSERKQVASHGSEAKWSLTLTAAHK